MLLNKTVSKVVLWEVFHKVINLLIVFFYYFAYYLAELQSCGLLFPLVTLTLNTVSQFCCEILI